jgi:catechol O-methyltransferase
MELSNKTMQTLNMNGFDEKKAYAEQEEVFFDDGREIELLHFVYSHAQIEQLRGSPTKVLEVVDEYARTKKVSIHVLTQGSIC